jgi:tetratricopeptide (TPR) repeat protein
MPSQPTTNSFIGREKEIEAFVTWLTSPTSPWILYFYDALEDEEKKGGVGKTWLLRKCIELARDKLQATVVMIDFFNIADRDGIAVAEHIVRELQATYPQWSPQAFATALQEYHNPVESENIDIVEDVRLKISDALTTDLHGLEEHFLAKDAYLLIFFDTFEIIERNPTIAVLHPGRTFPDNYHFERMCIVMAGRNALDWTHPNWQGREHEVECIALAPFSQQEMIQYLDAKSVYNLNTQYEQARALYERTNGRPILLGLVKDVLNQRILTLDELVAIQQANFESYLVAQINRLENPLNWVVLFMAHVYHHFNAAILEWIMHALNMQDLEPYTEHTKLLAILPTLSFVRYPGYGSDFVLHDEMRRLVVKYCWDIQDPDQDVRKEISRHMVSYYELEMVETLNKQRQEYIIEMLYHRLYVNLDDGLNYFDSNFDQALTFSKTAFARLMLQEAQKFLPAMSLAQRNALQLIEVRLYRTEENPNAALELLQQISQEADPQWYMENKAVILHESGRSYILQSKLREAAESYTQSLEIEQAKGNELQCARLLNNLGAIYRRRGQFATALQYYEESIALYKKLGRQNDYASVLANISNVYRLQGKIEEALRRCKIALRIRLELTREGKISEEMIGISLLALGRIYLDEGNIVAAEQHFKGAFDIFQRMNYKTGMIIIYNRFGQVQLLKGELGIAQEWFVKAQEASRDIGIDQHISSLNKQGRICASQQKWEEAASFFERAISIAQALPDYYQQTESLIDLANTLEHLKQENRVQHILQSAENIAIRENYLLLLGQIEYTRGELYYKDRQYKQAFDHFALYCHYMAQYNFVKFRKAVHEVVDILLRIPKDEVSAIVQEMLIYWKMHQLDQNYPELIQTLEEIDDLMIHL